MPPPPLRQKKFGGREVDERDIAKVKNFFFRKKFFFNASATLLKCVFMGWEPGIRGQKNNRLNDEIFKPTI